MDSKVKKLFQNYFIDGLILILIGLVMTIFADACLKVIWILMGAGVAFLGLVNLFFVFSEKSNEALSFKLPVAIAELVMGIMFIVRADLFIEIFQIIVAILLIYGAVVMLVRGFSERKTDNVTFIISLVVALAMIVFAIVVFINPIVVGEETAKIIVRIYGISMMIEGVGFIVVMRKAKKQIKKAEKEVVAPEPEKENESEENDSEDHYANFYLN